MKDAPLVIRVASSLEALGICWFVAGIVFGLFLRDARGFFLFYFWSLPFFAVGWVLVGIPIIVMGNRIVRVPKILLGVAGAIAGALIVLLPTLVLWVTSRGAEHFKLDWDYWRGWPAFGAAIGASGVLVYSWLLARATYRTRSKLNTD